LELLEKINIFKEDTSQACGFHYESLSNKLIKTSDETHKANTKVYSLFFYKKRRHKLDSKGKAKHLKS